jgi:hypothetical protein
MLVEVGTPMVRRMWRRCEGGGGGWSGGQVEK